MKVWLVKKHADRINGIDLTGKQVGDALELPQAHAELLLAEGWVSERRPVAGRRVQPKQAADRRGSASGWKD